VPKPGRPSGHHGRGAAGGRGRARAAGTAWPRPAPAERAGGTARGGPHGGGWLAELDVPV
jgi:hypothetical protein